MQIALLRAKPSKDGDAEPRGYGDLELIARPAGPPANPESLRDKLAARPCFDFTAYERVVGAQTDRSASD